MEREVPDRRDLLAGSASEDARSVDRDAAVLVLPAPLVGHG